MKGRPSSKPAILVLSSVWVDVQRNMAMTITSHSLEAPYKARTISGRSGHGCRSGETSYSRPSWRLPSVRRSMMGLARTVSGSRAALTPASSVQRPVSR
jgi:hypothetical protein